MRIATAASERLLYSAVAGTLLAVAVCGLYCNSFPEMIHAPALRYGSQLCWRRRFCALFGLHCWLAMRPAQQSPQAVVTDFIFMGLVCLSGLGWSLPWPVWRAWRWLRCGCAGFALTLLRWIWSAWILCCKLWWQNSGSLVRLR